MANVVLNNDPSMGSDCPPVNAIASSKVTINGKTIVLEGDSYTPHCNHTPHATATCKITINGKKIILHGDPLDCGDHATASSKVNVV